MIKNRPFISSRKSRRNKNLFIHKDDGWSRCVVEKRSNQLTYFSKQSTQNAFLENTYYSQGVDNKSNRLPLTLHGKVFGFVLKQLESLYVEVEKSKYILSLDKDFGNEVEYDSIHWKKVILFLVKLATKIHTCYNEYVIPIPKIYHGPNDSIDLFWENANFNLLVNIPTTGIATFYGDNYKDTKVEGVFNIADTNVHILPFIIELR